MQSSVNDESSIRGVHHSGKLTLLTPQSPTPWEDWRDRLHLSLIAKGNIDIENLKKPKKLLK